MKRVGIYGGTFSPPHIGHVRAAEAFLNEVELDELLIIPTFLPPHKTIDGEATPEERLEMSRIAFSDLPKIRISDIEIKKGGRSYTYLTLDELKDESTELFLLVGTDMFLTLDLWRCPDVIFSLANIVLVRRENDRNVTEDINAKVLEYKKKFGADIKILNTAATEISSSEIRASLSSGKGYEKLLSPNVAAYIKANRLYGASFTDDDVQALQQEIGKRLSNKRFLHTLGVKDVAMKISEHCSPEIKYEIAIAALLHDVAKELPEKEQMILMTQSGSLTEDDLESKSLYHAFAAPALIRRDFPEYATKDVLSSVFNHTTGAPKMSLFDEIIFVADYIEEGREYPECINAREALYKDLSDSKEESIKALHRCALTELRCTRDHLLRKGGKINKRTLETISYLETLIF